MRALLATSAIVIATARAASADPPAPGTKVIWVEAYPHRAVERPLILEPGILEGTAQLDYQHLGVPGQRLDIGRGVLGGRASLGSLQLALSASLFAFQTGELAGLPEPARLSEGTLSARYALTPDKAIGIDVRYINTGSGEIAPRAVMIKKLHVAPRAAIVIAGYFGGNTSNSDLGYSLITIAGEARAQAQITEHVMAEIGGTLGYNATVGSGTLGNPVPDDFLAQSYGLHLVASITCALDVIAGVELLQTGATDLQVFTIGVAGRRFR